MAQCKQACLAPRVICCFFSWTQEVSFVVCVSFVLLFLLAFRLTSPKRQLCQLRFSDSHHWRDRNLCLFLKAFLCSSRLEFAAWTGLTYKCVVLLENKRSVSFPSQRKKMMFLWISGSLDAVICKGLILVVLQCLSRTTRKSQCTGLNVQTVTILGSLTCILLL